jgi:hypothetical protein
MTEYGKHGKPRNVRTLSDLVGWICNDWPTWSYELSGRGGDHRLSINGDRRNGFQ